MGDLRGRISVASVLVEQTKALRELLTVLAARENGPTIWREIGWNSGFGGSLPCLGDLLGHHAQGLGFHRPSARVVPESAKFAREVSGEGLALMRDGAAAILTGRHFRYAHHEPYQLLLAISIVVLWHLFSQTAL